MKAKKIKNSVLSLSVATAILITSVSALASAEILKTGMGLLESVSEGESIHESIDMSEITGEGGNPAEVSSDASALANEKAWYEYVSYSTEPVGVYIVDDNTRIVFYDPYDYSNSLVMEVDDSITNWSSANSLTASYTNGNSMSTGLSQSTDTTSTIQIQDGLDESGGHTDNYSRSWSKGKIATYNESKTNAHTTTTDQGESQTDTFSLDAGFDLKIFKVGGSGSTSTTDHGTITTTYDEVTNTDSGWTQDNSEHFSDTDLDVYTWSKVADRITNSIGSSASTVTEWSTNDSATISKTYNATYFNESGSPLQWKIVKYTVTMPMYYQVQCLLDNEWIVTSSAYCLLTTVQGTCRSWMQNNTAYYEHWGTGEPVTWNDFWSRFFTKEQLVEAYKNKLYPDR